MEKKQLCDVCKKNEATIHINEIIGGKKSTLHICQECAQKKQAENDPIFSSLNIPKMIFDLSGKLAEATEQNTEVTPAENIPEAERRCPYCNWTLSQLHSNGKLGCSECYNTFHDLIARALQTMHRGETHIGRMPGEEALPAMAMTRLPDNLVSQTTPLEPQLPLTDKATIPSVSVDPVKELKLQLKEAIKKENYEEAALLRDKINALKAAADKKEMN